jgi:beta-1,4-mannosyl-glycoprotein beta-1,4-N-acetylglucosaminyltransferase
MLIDAFMFAWELDILEIRLNELNPVVDKFVIVESLEMHGSANTKTPVLANNWCIAAPFESKIEYVIVDKLEPSFGEGTSWLRENYHRNCLLAPIKEVSSPDDIVMISDCDEIPRASTIQRNLPILSSALFGTRQDLFYYNVNNFVDEWHGTVIGPVKTIEAIGPQAARNKRDSLPFLDNAGWHFSYFGGIDRIRTKTKNFAHAPEPICKDLSSRSDAEVLQDVSSGIDLYRRSNDKMTHRESNDSRLPKYYLDNINRFKHFTA